MRARARATPASVPGATLRKVSARAELLESRGSMATNFATKPPLDGSRASAQLRPWSTGFSQVCRNSAPKETMVWAPPKR